MLKRDAEPLQLFERTIFVPTLQMLIECKREGKRTEDPLKLRQLEATLARVKA